MYPRLLIVRWLNMFGIMITLCFVGPVASEPDWAASLKREINGTLIFSPSGVNTSELIPSYTRNPFPEDETAHPPLAVLVAQGTSDVEAAVKTARDYNLTIAASGGRHWTIDARNAASGLTVDLSQMRGVTVDPVQQTAVVEGGALGGDVLHEAAKWGLSLPWGDVNATGMGLALAGGIGLAMRQHGLACDSILAAQIVIANGSLISVSDTEHPDLLAGVRGGGTVFGIVTALTFRLFNASDVYAGHLMFADDANWTTSRYLNDFTVDMLPKYPGLGIEVESLPAVGQVMLQVNFFGNQSMEEKAAVFEPLRAMNPVADQLGPGVANIVGQTNYLTALTAGYKGVKAFWFSALMSSEQWGDRGRVAIWNAYSLAAEATPGPVLLTDWFGPATQNTTSFTPFKGAYMHLLIVLIHPDSQVLLSTSKQLEDALEGYATLYAYDNLSSDPYPEQNLATKLGGANNLQLLKGLKGLVDPHNMFKNHQFRGLTPT